MGRPKKDINEVKSIQVNVRFCKADYLSISENARILGLLVTDFIRSKSIGKALPRKKVSPHDRMLFVELGRIGNNLNQLTRKAHLGIHIPKELREEIKKLKEVVELLRSNIVKDDSRSN